MDPQGESPDPRPSLCCTSINVAQEYAIKRDILTHEASVCSCQVAGGESVARSFSDNCVPHAGRAEVGSVVRMKIIQLLTNNTKTSCFVYSQP